MTFSTRPASGRRVHRVAQRRFQVQPGMPLRRPLPLIPVRFISFCPHLRRLLNPVPFRTAYSGRAVTAKWSRKSEKKVKSTKKRIRLTPEPGSTNSRIAFRSLSAGCNPSESTKWHRTSALRNPNLHLDYLSSCACVEQCI